MQHIINPLLTYLKWPLAIIMVLGFMPVLKADMYLIRLTAEDLFFSFLLPMFAMVGFWFVIPGLHGSHLAIFEHEFTHMLAAVITGHMPRSMSIESDKGGSFGFYGKGNWLIVLAPYFVPTFPLIVMLFGTVFDWLNKPMPDVYLPVLGLMFGYHLISNIYQIHPKQTDFIKAGWLFSFLFLPTANLLSFGLVWSYAANKGRAVTQWLELIEKYTKMYIEQLF